jgi:hypothetical protein
MSWNILRLPTQQNSQERLEHFEMLHNEAKQSGNARDAQHWQGMKNAERHIHSHLRPPRAESIERLKKLS